MQKDLEEIKRFLLNNKCISQEKFNSLISEHNLTDEEKEELTDFIIMNGVSFTKEEKKQDVEVDSINIDLDDIEEVTSEELDSVKDINTDDYFAKNTTALRMHLNTIGKIPLLTAEEEKELAIRIANGDKEAREKMINANLRLVVSIAKRYVGGKMAFDDLIQEGTLGLMKAVDKFDPSMGYKFSTYATWWIRQAVTRSIADYGRTVRVPVHQNEEIRRMERIKREYETEHGGKEIPEALLAAEMFTNKRILNLNEEKMRIRSIQTRALKDGKNTFEKEYTPKLSYRNVVKKKIYDKYLKSDIEKLRDLKRVVSEIGDPASLDTYIGEDHDTTLGELVADDRDIENEVLNGPNFMAILTYVIQGDFLTDKEKLVVLRRFGYFKTPPKTIEEAYTMYELGKDQVNNGAPVEDVFIGKSETLAEIGVDLHVTRERIRQIEAKALRKMRHPSRAKRLKVYYLD